MFCHESQRKFFVLLTMHWNNREVTLVSLLPLGNDPQDCCICCPRKNGKPALVSDVPYMTALNFLHDLVQLVTSRCQILSTAPASVTELACLTATRMLTPMTLSALLLYADDDFDNPVALWKVIGHQPGHREGIIGDLFGSLNGVKYPKSRNAVHDIFPRHPFAGILSRTRLSPILFGRVEKDLISILQQRTEATIKTALASLFCLNMQGYISYCLVDVYQWLHLGKDM
ncbi:catalase [Penicillium sp. IBT 35674x]|nr:catalase [Penicillium sp. IBT 35674x]